MTVVRQALVVLLAGTSGIHWVSGHQKGRLGEPQAEEVRQTTRELQDEFGNFFTLRDHDEDLGLRFTKVAFPGEPDLLEELHDSGSLPLRWDDYPIDSTTADWLKYSNCPSIVIPENCRYCDDFESLVNLVGGHPSHPSRDYDNPYWDELLEVAEVQYLRMVNADPLRVMPLPDLWGDMNIGEVAEAVHDEYPGFHQANVIPYLLKNGATVDEDIIPMRSQVEFLNGPVMLAELNTWSIATVGPPNFGLKYHVGRSRPEEIAYQISKGRLTERDGVPPKVIQAIDRLGRLSKAENFTAYPEGCPMHPAWPAMHSAASSASLWLAVVLNLDKRQWCEAKKTDYAVAYARTVAGVHYQSDNIAGLNLGQHIIANALPDYLAEKYGSDPDKVRRKIEQYRFDWQDFLSSDCVN